MQEAVDSANLAVKCLESQRNQDSFNNFFSRIVEDSKELTLEPELPRYKRTPRRFDGHSSTTHRFDDVKVYFRQQYYEALETASGELKRRFQQTRGMPVAVAVRHC